MNHWVRQEHVNGCTIASLAMVLGRSYQSVHDEVAPQVWWYDSSEPYPDTDEQREARWHRGNDFSKRGTCLDYIFRWLERSGYATQLRYKYLWGHEIAEEWPPKPFAPIHLCGVTASMSHAIVMLGDGTLLDPNREPGTWSGSWSEYRSVEQVCGIWKVS